MLFSLKLLILGVQTHGCSWDERRGQIVKYKSFKILTWVANFQTCLSSCFQDQFEFALTAVAEEVNAILKALPQWNQYDPDRPPVRPPWLSDSSPNLSFLSTMMMTDIMKRNRDVIQFERFSEGVITPKIWLLTTCGTDMMCSGTFRGDKEECRFSLTHILLKSLWRQFQI